MVAPYDYTSAFANVPSPVDSFANSFKMGAGIRQMQLQQTAQEAELLKKQQMQQDLQVLYEKPTPRAIAQISLKYPEISEQLKRSNEMLSEEQRRSFVSAAAPIHAATLSGRNDIAAAEARKLAAAMESSGQDEDARHARVIADLIEQSPETAIISVGSLLSSLMGPDKYAEAFGEFGAEQRAQAEAPADLAKKQADATTAQAKAKYADSEALLDLEKKGWDITKIKSDIDINKQNSRIAAMNAAANRESNDLKRQELRLKIDEAKTKRDENIRTKTAEIESARTNMDNMLNTVDRVLNNKSLDDVIGSFEGRMPEAASALDDEESDAIALINTLKSQAFLAQIPNIKGMGALSNAEGDKLQSALQNLDRAQSDGKNGQFRASLKEAQRLILKGRKNLAEKYGVPESVPDRPAVPVAQLPPGFKILGKE